MCQPHSYCYPICNAQRKVLLSFLFHRWKKQVLSLCLGQTWFQAWLHILPQALGAESGGKWTLSSSLPSAFTQRQHQESKWGWYFLPCLLQKQFSHVWTIMYVLGQKTRSVFLGGHFICILLFKMSLERQMWSNLHVLCWVSCLFDLPTPPLKFYKMCRLVHSGL